MSRFVPLMLSLVLLIGIAGCGNSEKPAEPTKMSDEDKKKMEEGMAKQMQFHQQQSQGPGQAQPAGDGK